MRSFSLFSLLSLSPLLVNGQLSGTVGPLSSSSSKASTKTCDVTDYGAVADKKTDIGDAISQAWDDCSNGGVVYIPPGDYAMSTWLKLSGGKASAIQLDGIIYRTGSDGGNMFMIEHSSDFEFFSSTSKGAIQGLGYEFHKDGSLSGPRLLRFYDVQDFSVHDIALVDSPAFHLSVDTCTNGELYNMAVRGGDSGGLDGIDVWSENIWVHDVEVTNKDECVTVKSPAKNILVENIYCNWSGGCAMGSLGADTNISDITYRNVYTWKSNQMYMIKSNGGSGTVENVVLENFIGHGNSYSLDIDGAWSSMDTVDGDGVQLTNITVRNWTGGEENGAERGPVKVVCAEKAPCTEITIEDFAMWTESGDSQSNTCENAFGSGSCLQEGDGSSTYSTAVTDTAAPSGYSATTMAEDLTTAFGTDASIPIPTIPTTFYPGATPYSALAGAGSAAATPAATAAAASRMRRRTWH
ncbi:RGase A [Aspergillus avenaceus]|uniref:rhamnogalacturonan hydrolase n=1 Tax=Aspergillus avenaceus TaxID=36643 RepID=A0A5N6TD07_ASPAV|nr:RGase A [Aspergillus avenaceus]